MPRPSGRHVDSIQRHGRSIGQELGKPAGESHQAAPSCLRLPRSLVRACPQGYLCCLTASPPLSMQSISRSIRAAHVPSGSSLRQASVAPLPSRDKPLLRHICCPAARACQHSRRRKGRGQGSRPLPAAVGDHPGNRGEGQHSRIHLWLQGRPGGVPKRTSLCRRGGASAAPRWR